MQYQFRHSTCCPNDMNQTLIVKYFRQKRSTIAPDVWSYQQRWINNYGHWWLLCHTLYHGNHFFDCELVSQSYKPLFFQSPFLNFRYSSIFVSLMNFQIEFTFSNWILIFCNQPFLNFGYLYIIFSTNWIYNFFHFLIGLLLFLIIKWIFFPILKCIFLLFSNWNFFNSMNIYLHFQLHPQTRVSSKDTIYM